MMSKPEDEAPAPSAAGGEKVRPSGDPLDWSEADLDALSSIGPAVIADSRADARRYPALRAFLIAEDWDNGQRSG
jgi:hypothetical protein